MTEGAPRSEQLPRPSQLEKPEIKAGDICRSLPEIGGSKIILQRHERYQREPVADAADIHLGSLTLDSTKRAYDQSRQIIIEMLSSIPKIERTNVSFLITGSTTKFKDRGMRSMETAEQVIQALRDELAEEKLDQDQIENNHSRA